MRGPAARRLTCAGLLLAAAIPARAQVAPLGRPPAAGSPAAGSPAAGSPAPASAVSTPLSEEAEQAYATTPVVVDGQELFRLRGFASYPSDKRARLVAERIEEAARDDGTPPAVTATPSAEGMNLYAGEHFLTTATEADARLEGLRLDALAQLQASRIEQAIRAHREARSPAVMLEAAEQAAVATVALVVAILVGLAGLRRFDRWLARAYEASMRSVEAQSLWIGRALRLKGLLKVVTGLLRFALVAVLAFVWLQFVLSRFPPTRPLAERLLQLFLDPLARLASAFVASLPALAFLFVLYLLTRWALRLIRLFFEAVGRGQVELSDFEPEWARPTYRLVRLVVVALAVVVAYPYIPGSRSPAFQGITVFLGLMFSIGSSSVVANTIAGYSMTYRRAFKLGDWIEVGDVVGEVTEVRLQVTHLRTVRNQEVVIPNTSLLSSNVANLSVLARTHGLVLHTTVGIGYDTPWRQVEALLLEAAARTTGLLREPAPFVLEESLGDFAVVYELNVHADDPARMPALYARLHQSILDVFNEYGVQIMSPHYEGDQEPPKLVPKERWWAAPARPPGEPGRSGEPRKA